MPVITSMAAAFILSQTSLTAARSSPAPLSRSNRTIPQKPCPTVYRPESTRSTRWYCAGEPRTACTCTQRGLYSMAKDFLKQALRFLGKVLAASLLLLPGLALAEPPIAPFKQTFVLTSCVVPFSITAVRRLKADDKGIWHMSVSDNNWLGEITESTAFSWQNCVPQSSQYRYKRVGLGKEKYAVVAFDQAAGEAHVRRDDRRKSYAITGTTTDKIGRASGRERG